MRFRSVRRAVLQAGLACALPLAAGAQPTSPPDKSRYTLFDPTPRELMRPMRSDRPDQTENPFTLDAGHFQLETGFVSYERNESGGAHDDEWKVLDSQLNVGLTNRLDAELLFPVYQRDDHDDGFGDLTLRAKLNLWGNDPETDHPTAFAFLPFVKVPTGTDVSNDHVEGGVSLPFAWQMSSRLELSATAQFDFDYDEDGRDYDTHLTHTAQLGIDLNEAFGTWLEYVGLAAVEGGGNYEASLGTGVSYQVGPNAILDAGVQAALNDAAPVVSATAGLSLRF